jgi:7,8-dihydroneopterin aldolase/epimerase/oxygenase
MNAKSSLFINAVELEVFLGWPNEERMRRQVISVDMELRFPSVPQACTSDNLKDTVCYRDLIEKLRAEVAVKKYHLIEHLTVEVYNIVKSLLPQQTTLSVSLNKHPQIQGLGSVTFKYCDDPL